MKKIFRKNQLMITALAFMLAIAGYFSFMNENLNDEQVVAEAGAKLLKEEYEISDEDMILEENIFVAEELMEADGEDMAATDGDTDGAIGEENPGEIMFTSMSVSVDYASQMKLS